MDKDTNQPHLLRFLDDDLPTQYLVVVEQSVHVETTCILKGIFIVFALHYVYDLHYHSRLSDFFDFFEDKLLSIELSSFKKSACYSSITSGIECYLN